MNISKLESKRIVFIVLSIGYLILTIIEMITDVSVPSAFSALVGGVIGHYFGYDNGVRNKEVDK
jgi:hypothetical protein